MFFILEEVKETVLVFWQETVRALLMCSLIFFLIFGIISEKSDSWNSINVKLLDYQVDELKPTIKNATEVTLGYHQTWLVKELGELNFPIRYY